MMTCLRFITMLDQQEDESGRGKQVEKRIGPKGRIRGDRIGREGKVDLVSKVDLKRPSAPPLHLRNFPRYELHFCKPFIHLHASDLSLTSPHYAAV